jgi:oligosaccharide repeat unit polymerase
MSIIPTALVDDRSFRANWRTPKSISTDTLILFSCAVVALEFGALLAIAATKTVRSTTSPWPALSPATLRLLSKASTVMLVATLIGYTFFVFLIIRAGITPAMLLGTVKAGLLRDAIGTIPGVTTMTQLGIAVVVLSTTVLVQSYSRAELAKVLTVVGVAMLRVYINSERLAILELFVPIAVILAAKFSIRPGMARRITQTVPVVGLFSVVVIFGFFEYFRSWQFYRLHTDMSFLDFTLSRFAGYYMTALNNGQLILQHLDWQGRWPFDTLTAFWSAPGIGQLALYERLGGHPRPYSDHWQSPYFEVLNQFGNPELNNPSGYVGPFIDYGPYGGLLFFFAIGFFAGFLYRKFCAGQPVGLLLYPVFFVGLVEIPRYLYWVQGRSTYAWLALAVVIVLVTKSANRDQIDRAPLRQPGTP